MLSNKIFVKPLSQSDMPAASRLYHASFPPEEQRAWEQIADADSMPLALGVYRGEEFAGIATVWPFGHFVYIEHLAIDPAMRNGGIGAEAIRQLKSRYGLPLVLEVEPAEHPDPMAARRIDFYRRCGFTLLDHPYRQPPYAPGLPWVELRLMTTDPTLDPAAITATLHREVYKIQTFCRL